jgi:5-methylcytosine-specific restriction endonuclease McrA
MPKMECLTPRLGILGSRLSVSTNPEVTAGRSRWRQTDAPTRQQRGYGAAWDKLRLLILKRDRYLCRTCLRQGRVAAAHTVDHVVPKAEGGNDDPANLESICVPCHRIKTQAEANRTRMGGA